MVGMEAMPAMPGEAPRYFSHPNYANSPLPMIEGAVIPVGNPLQDRAYATDFPVGVGELAPVFVVLPPALPDGMIQSFQTWNQAALGASPFASAGNVFHAYVLRPTGIPNEYTVIFDSGLLTVPALADPLVWRTWLCSQVMCLPSTVRVFLLIPAPDRMCLVTRLRLLRCRILSLRSEAQSFHSTHRIARIPLVHRCSTFLVRTL
jgi:hypothetical protein